MVDISALFLNGASWLLNKNVIFIYVMFYVVQTCQVQEQAYFV